MTADYAEERTGIATSIPVNGPSPYEVHIGRGLTSAIADHVKTTKARQAMIVYQAPLQSVADELRETVEQAGVDVTLAVVPDAENGKTLEVTGRLWDALGTANFSRQDLVIGLGGGAVTDLAGFVAATWMRGIKVVQVPTTLLAMVDAAVGGKTGINTEAGKNLVGAFHEPNAVFIDLDRLDTLPEEEFVSGSAEIIKTGFISDTEILNIYSQGKDVWQSRIAELIERSVAVKARVVGQDLKESSLREILNYGHTLGHAIEKREDYSWRHGNAVAVGMMFVAQLAYRRGLIDAEVVDKHRAILEDVGLPTTYDAGAFDELYEGMTHDKKNRDGRIRFVVIEGLGQTARLEDATIDEMRAAYAEVAK
ncbi:3-dehydroquinate synthase [Corynebacterium aquatimens]|uniref:3-dehydroquinate synthase n=1 Tax=Corynebacterium aquatimens TaxID=1190508 RepID=A0A931GVU0_9CORY|nr:3-dehydroquinate synthase [Corynebacterium aquatimens]MBG6121696.1 3-dehydroquinate synthase [Corynebacterium aquatimens]WJY65765.1 3-dehydroquinate synthase [Corynebacterium aquatimens]